MRAIVKDAVREAELYAADMFDWKTSVTFNPVPGELFENKETYASDVLNRKYLSILKNPTLHLVIYILDKKCYTATLYLKTDNEIFQYEGDGGLYNSGFGFLKLYSFKGEVS